jgi:hypothetical protein
VSFLSAFAAKLPSVRRLLLAVCAGLVVAAPPAQAGTGYLHRAEAVNAAESHARSAAVHDYGATSSRVYDCRRVWARGWVCDADYLNVSFAGLGPGWTWTEPLHVVMRHGGRITVAV